MKSLAYYVDGIVEGRRGTLVQRQKDRSVWRVEQDGLVWFAKRGVTPKRRREIRREAENARLLHARNAGPVVLVSGSWSGGEWLVTEAAGPVDLSMTLGVTSLLPEAAQVRPLLLRHVAAAVRRLHQDGICLPDLSVEHIFSSHERTLFIDPARMRRSSEPASMRRRARDLAALVFSLALAQSWDPARRTAAVRLLAGASGFCDEELRDLCRRVDSGFSELASRRRWRHRACAASEELVEALNAARGDDQYCVFDGLMNRKGMEIVRTLPDRENRRLDTRDDGTARFFVKVYPPTKSAGWSPAMREVAAIDLFQRAGILVNRLAAYAEDVDKGSMVAVKAAAGEPLDDLLRRGVSVAERRALAVQTARIWRRMRECGLRHRDAYPCHLFAAPWGSQPLRFELRLIDMTRAGQAPFPKERWFVKDAAALWHGLPKPPVTRTDAVRWLREYFRIPRLDARAKRFARRVAAKEARIAARQARKAKR